jgi:hypothetical protein
VGLAGGLNRFTYAENSPVLTGDPDGEFVFLAVAGVALFLLLASERPADVPTPGYHHRPVLSQIDDKINEVLKGCRFGTGDLPLACREGLNIKGTPPTPGPPLIYNSRGVRIVHKYHGGEPGPGVRLEHSPAHAHVEGGGPETRIGPQGYPLEGDRPLTRVQQTVVEEGQNIIRHRLNRIGRWLKYLEELGRLAEEAP